MYSAGRQLSNQSCRVSAEASALFVTSFDIPTPLNASVLPRHDYSCAATFTLRRMSSPVFHFKAHPAPQFPTHNSPRCWFITDALNPLAVRLIRLLLIHGDYIAAGLPPSGLEDEERSAEFKELISECKTKEGWMGRIRGIKCDAKKMSDCQSAVAEAKQMTGRIDILLLCSSEGIEPVCYIPINITSRAICILTHKHNSRGRHSRRTIYHHVDPKPCNFPI